jgi:hypothetical protein
MAWAVLKTKIGHRRNIKQAITSYNQHVEGMLGSEILGRESLTSPT